MINKHPVIAAGVVLLTLGVVTASYWWPTSGQRSAISSPVYYYDLNTGKLFVAEAGSGPLETDSGPFEGEPAGVRAHVFACGRSADAANQFIGWLSKPMGDPEAEEAEAVDLIRRPLDRVWVRADSPEGERIMTELESRCGTEAPLSYCHPPRAR